MSAEVAIELTTLLPGVGPVRFLDPLSFCLVQRWSSPSKISDARPHARRLRPSVAGLPPVTYHVRDGVEIDIETCLQKDVLPALS